MATSNPLPFSYVQRWPMFKELGLPDDVTRALEDRDRQIEDYLGKDYVKGPRGQLFEVLNGPDPGTAGIANAQLFMTRAGNTALGPFNFVPNRKYSIRVHIRAALVTIGAGPIDLHFFPTLEHQSNPGVISGWGLNTGNADHWMSVAATAANHYDHDYWEWRYNALSPGAGPWYVGLGCDVFGPAGNQISLWFGSGGSFSLHDEGSL